MTTYDLQQLLFVFTFCIMVLDGTIGSKELQFNKHIYDQIEMDQEISYETMANMFISNLKENPTDIIGKHLHELDGISFTDEEKLEFLKAAHDMIYADNQVHPLEKEFLLLSKNKLGITDVVFQNIFPEYSIEGETISNQTNFVNEFLNSLNFSQLEPIE